MYSAHCSSDPPVPRQRAGPQQVSGGHSGCRPGWSGRVPGRRTAQHQYKAYERNDNEDRSKNHEGRTGVCVFIYCFHTFPISPHDSKVEDAHGMKEKHLPPFRSPSTLGVRSITPIHHRRKARVTQLGVQRRMFQGDALPLRSLLHRLAT